MVWGSGCFYLEPCAFPLPQGLYIAILRGAQDHGLEGPFFQAFLGERWLSLESAHSSIIPTPFLNLEGY